MAASVSACWEPLVTSSSSASVGSPRAVSRAAIAARSSGSPSVVEYWSARPARSSEQRGRERVAQARRRRTARAPAGRRRTRSRPARAVSARISRTGELRTPRRREAIGGKSTGGHFVLLRIGRVDTALATTGTRAAGALHGGGGAYSEHGAHVREGRLAMSRPFQFGGRDNEFQVALDTRPDF